MKSLLIICILTISGWCQAQNQLVLLHREKVLARYKEGSVISYKLKDIPEYQHSIIVQIQDYAFITGFDTIPFGKIERVSLKGQPNRSLFNLFGTAIFSAGVAYFLIDQGNSLFVHNTGYDNDPAVWKPTVAMIAVGLVMKQIHKRSQRIRFPAKLYTAKRGNPFFEEEN